MSANIDRGRKKKKKAKKSKPKTDDDVGVQLAPRLAKGQDMSDVFTWDVLKDPTWGPAGELL